MSYYKTCPRCGAHLDPGETCDCLDVEAQLLVDHVKKAPAGAANADEGKVEQVRPNSTSHDN